RACRGDYIVTMDLDLSYSPDHIEKLLTKIRQTGSKVVVASPYMKGGRVSNVPRLRLLLSVWANRFLSLAAKRNVATLTGMVRVYDAQFLRTLNLRSPGMEINPEIIHKATLLNEPVEEVPAHLCWNSQRASKKASKEARREARKKPGQARRKSSMKIFRHTWSMLFFGFLFRPVMFFVIPSLVFFVLSLYANAWVLIHCWTNYQQLRQLNAFPDPTEAVAAAFQQAPHTFIIGGMLLMLAIQLFSLGILSVQNKRYFEEVFYLGAATYRDNRDHPRV
ncbi:MAG: glycosyltransferase family 2 protein, partial [Cyanobacteria bacterium P01_F01_bin.116]